MASAESLDYADMLSAIQRWSTEDRLMLVRDVLRTLESASPERTPERRQRALQRLQGMLADVEPKPSDADIKRMLEEERLRKYG